MRKLRSHLLSLLLLSALPSFLFAALASPNFAAARNFGGPIVIFWDTGDNDVVTSQYQIFVSTASMAGKDYDFIITTRCASDTGILTVPYPSSTAATNAAMNYIWKQAQSGKTYFLRIAALDYTTNTSSIAAAEISVTSQYEDTKVSSITVSVDGVANKYIANYDTQTIRFDLYFTAQSGPCIPPDHCKIDIKTLTNPSSVFTDASKVPMEDVIISSAPGASLAHTSFLWNGTVDADSANKHNGLYFLEAIPVVNGSEITNGKKTATCGTDVVHINKGTGLQYATAGSGSTIYGPPFKYYYNLSRDCYVTWKIWDRHHTETRSDDTVVRVVVSTVARVCSDQIIDPRLNSALSWNKNPNWESWDGRDENGMIVPNGIYRFTLQAIANQTANPNLVDSAHGFYVDDQGNLVYANWVEGTISFDVLRLADISATGITDTASLAHLKYTLGGANSAMGGATIKIIICTPGTTFYMAAGAGTATYLNGAGTYRYVAGDPMPTDINCLKKVFVFQRSAGTMDETWNGYDEAGTALPNNNYVFAISATDDSGNHAIDNSGNDRIVVGNVTIDRTAAQQAGDSVPPNIMAIAVNGTTILTGGGSTLTSSFSTIVIQMQDPGGSGVDLINSLVTLTGPNANFITLTPTNNGVDTMTLTFGNQTTNGTYTLRIRPRDKVGNTASDTVCSFTLNMPVTGPAAVAPVSFENSITAYPNPAKGANTITFAYTTPAATILKLEVYSILGEPVYEEQWSTGSGEQTKNWNIVNKSQNRLASGMYLYRLTDQNSANKPKKLRKLIIIQ